MNKFSNSQKSIEQGLRYKVLFTNQQNRPMNLQLI